MTTTTNTTTLTDCLILEVSHGGVSRNGNSWYWLTVRQLGTDEPTRLRTETDGSVGYEARNYEPVFARTASGEYSRVAAPVTLTLTSRGHVSDITGEYPTDLRRRIENR